jgi:hypothetical protein
VGFQGQLFATAFSGAGAGDTVPQARTTRVYEAATPTLATIDPTTGVFTAVGAGPARFRVTFTPTDGGAAFTAEGGQVTVEVPVAVDSASTYGDNLEFGAPTPTGNANDFLIRRRQFAASYNASRGQPNWVSYEYDARQTGGEDRCNCFTTDPLVVAAGLPVVTTADYVGSGYSRGHMARSADRTRSNVENAATFYLTNIVPQIQDQNGGPWATLENQLGDSTRAGRAVYIVDRPAVQHAQRAPLPERRRQGRHPRQHLEGGARRRPRPGHRAPAGVTDIASWSDLAGERDRGDDAQHQLRAGAQRRLAHLPPHGRPGRGGHRFDVLSLLQAPYQPALEAGDRRRCRAQRPHDRARPGRRSPSTPRAPPTPTRATCSPTRGTSATAPRRRACR